MAETTAHLEPGRCLGCCRWGPTRRVTYEQTIGALLVRFPRSVQGELCRQCRQRYFWTYTGVTVILGWWGLISLVSTLIILPGNVLSHLRSLGRGRSEGAPDSGGACFWCGRRDLRPAPIPPELIVAAVVAIVVVTLVPWGLPVAAIPVVALVVRWWRRTDHCPGCGNEQPGRPRGAAVSAR